MAPLGIDLPLPPLGSPGGGALTPKPELPTPTSDNSSKAASPVASQATTVGALASRRDSEIGHALSAARKESRLHQRRIRYPSLVLGAACMAGSFWFVFTPWTLASSLWLLGRDLLRSWGLMCWLCACLPSDHWAPKIGSTLLFILGVKCAIWHTDTMVSFVGQVRDFKETGRPCTIEDEETDCMLGALTICTVSMMYILMHLWQLPYLALGLRLPPRATSCRLWVGLALLHLTKAAADFLVHVPAMAVKGHRKGAIPFAAMGFVLIHGFYALVMGCLLRWPKFRQWVHFRLLKHGGDLSAAASISAFLGNRTAGLVMETAKCTARYVSLDKVQKADMQKNTPDKSLQVHSTPCNLQDIDAFLSHSWHDDPEAKWTALQAWRRAFRAQHQREPRVWIDKYCIDQTNIEASLMCLPVFLAGCHTLLIIAGPTYLSRLWCVEEVFVYLQMGRSIQSIELFALSADFEERVRAFDVEAAQTFLDVDREKLLATIEAGCEGFEAFNIQVRAALQAALRSTQA